LKGWGTEYDLESSATKKAKELGATENEVSKYGALFSLLRPISGVEIDRRRRARQANIEIVKNGVTSEQIKNYVTVDGADINIENCKALEWAVKENDLEKAKVILSLGGSPNLKPKKEEIINNATSLDMIKLLVENSAELTAQVYNNICHDLEAVKFCLDNGLDPSFDDSLPLRRSCKGSWKSVDDIGQSYIDAIKLLLKYGASLTDKRGRYMILKWAIEYGRKDVIDYVVQNGATMGFLSAYVWLGHSRKINEGERKKCALYLIDLIEKFEKKDWDEFDENKKWHLK
jgi:ankyrin repeat protein